MLEWRDAMSRSGWRDVRELIDADLTLHVCGYLVAVTRDRIIMALADEGDKCAPLVIPREAVRSLRQLR